MRSVSTWISTAPVGRFGLTASARARDDLPLGLEDELVADLLRELGRLGRVLRVDHELRDPGAVAEVDEHEAAVVAATRDPAGEGLARADVLLAELAAHEVAPAHGDSLPTMSAWASGSSACPGRRRTAPSERDDHGRRGAEAGRLGQLPLERAPRVVGVGRDPAPPQLGEPARHLLPRRALLEREEDVDRRRARR